MAVLDNSVGSGIAIGDSIDALVSSAWSISFIRSVLFSQGQNEDSPMLETDERFLMFYLGILPEPSKYCSGT
jgi:hypothetical protein